MEARCFMGITRVVQGCLRDVSGLSQGYLRVSQRCSKGNLRVFPWPFYGCSEGVSRNNASKNLQGRFTEVSRII